jgi:hypothetical protein
MPCTNQFNNHMPEALSLFAEGPLALVAGEGFDPRPLGYEPYDGRRRRLGQSLADAVISADETKHVPLALSRLPVSACFATSGLQIGLQNRRFPSSPLAEIRASHIDRSVRLMWAGPQAVRTSACGSGYGANTATPEASRPRCEAPRVDRGTLPG